MTLSLKQATIEDAETLARMNKHLIEDEGHRNPMNVSQLAERMARFLSDEYRADLILDEGEVVGYVLYRFQRDDFDQALSAVYLRHYFIAREQRRKGYGRRALQLLRRERFGQDAEVVVEVLSKNKQACRFWAAVGFAPYSITMKLPPGTGVP